ncbi:Mis12-Mtw1 protein family-domain-containing protein [Phlyctochytrium arcticum]|nr:Mis12-Mtw1 protein family-domain-containing protein [Phlyctochytrium arcticum]
MTAITNDRGFVFKPRPQKTRREPQPSTENVSLPSCDGPGRKASGSSSPSGNESSLTLTIARSADQHLKDFTVNIPVRDTPAINRNRALRSSDGRRRSSLGMRGKRASSNRSGVCQPPHDSINPSNFYRHIDAELSDPNRMRYLLIWCAQRTAAVETVPKSQSPVDICCHQIKKEIISKLSNKDIDVSWYHRRSTNMPKPAAPVKKMEHPQNKANLHQLHEYQREIDRLLVEQESWNQIRKQEKSIRRRLLVDEERFFQEVQQRETALPLDAPDIEILNKYMDNKSQASSTWMLEKQAAFLVELQNAIQSWQHLAVFHRRVQHFASDVFEKALLEEERTKSHPRFDPIDVLRLLSNADKI